MSLEHRGEIEPGSYVQTRLSYVSKACFYVTLVEDEPFLQDIRRILKEANEGKQRTINRKFFTKGDAVSVLDEADQFWHRGLVTGCFGHLIEVFLVDSGKDIITERNMSDVGCQFLTHFERKEDELWEVKLYIKRVYPANSPDKTMLNKSRSYSSQSEEISDNLIVETGFKHFTRENAIGAARQRLCIAMKDNLFTPNSDTNFESNCSMESNSMQLSISTPCRGIEFDAYVGDYSCQTSGVKPWKGTFYSKSDKGHSSKTDAKKSLRHPKCFGDYENPGFQTELRHTEKGTDTSSVGDGLNHELYEMLNRSCVIKETPKNIAPKTSVAHSLVENREAQRLCITELNTDENYECATNSLSNESIKDLQHMLNSNSKMCPSIPKAQIRCNVELTAIISDIDDDGNLWIQAVDQISSLDKLMSEINQTNSEYLKIFKDKPSINSPCLSLYKEDQRFYRAIVKEYVGDKDCVLVHYVDYGKSDSTEISSLRVIPDRFLDLPSQAIQCNFPESVREQLLGILHEEIENTFTEEINITLGEDPLENTLILKSFIISGSDIISKIHKEEEANCTAYKGDESEEISHENQVNEVTDTCMKIPLHSIKYETEMTVHVTHVDNIGKFWVQVSENYSQIEKMMVVMNEFALNSGSTLISSPNIGEPCLCPYSKDGQFYRAEIRQINPQVSSAKVHYIDYGDTGNVEISKLFVLPRQFVTLPRQAICCYFSSDIRNKWSSSTQKYLEELLEKDIFLTLTQEVDGSELKNVVMKLSLDGSDVVSQLTSLVLSNDSNRETAKSGEDSDTEDKLKIENDDSKVETDEKILKSENDKSEDVLCEEDISQILLKYDDNVDAFVSHVEGNCVWIQLLDKFSALDELQENLNSSSLQPLTGIPAVGSICISYFSDDEMFYRALVKEVDLTCNSALVQYIDYGNSSLVKIKDLYILPFDFISLPRQAIECYFSNFSKVYKECIEELLNKEVTVSISSNSGEGKNILRSCIVDGEDILLCERLNASDVEERAESLYEVKTKKEITREAPVYADTRHLPPPHILYDKEFSAFVCLTERDSIWIQSSQYLPQLKELMEKLNTMPLQKMQNFPSVEFPCVSRLDEDGKYYRVVVKKIDTECLTAVVEYIDYGKVNTVTFENLFELPECCYCLPKQAIQCYFRHENDKVSELHENKVELFEQFVEISLNLVNETGESMNIISNCTWNSTDVVSSSRARNSESKKSSSEITNEPVFKKDNEIVKPDSSNQVEKSDYKVNLELKENTGTNISVCNSRILSSDCSKIHCKGISTDENIVKSEQPSLNCEELFTATVSHIEDDGSLWIQPCRCIPALNALMEKLNELSRSLIPVKDTPLVGSVYACPYVEDGRWYRATVKEILADKCLALVQYIDYGNEGSVKINELHTIPEDLLRLPEQAVHCFFDKTINKDWSEQQQSLMEETEYEVRVSVCRDAKDCGYLVFKDFFIGETDMLSLLEYNKNEPQVHEMKNRILYRTELRSSNSDSEQKLYFSEDKDMNKSLATSTKISLLPTEKSEGVMKVNIHDYKFIKDKLNKDAAEIKREDLHTKLDTLKITGPHVGNGNVFNFNISKLSLKSETKFAGVICHVENDGSFWLQMSDNLSALTDMMESLNELNVCTLEPLLESHVNGDIYICPYAADGKLYRASIVQVLTDGLAKVHYIDFGNEDHVKTDQLYKIPKEFLDLPPQAIHCCFNETIRKNWSKYHQSFIEELATEVSVSIFPDTGDYGYLVIKEISSEEMDILSLLSCDEEKFEVLKREQDSKVEETKLSSPIMSKDKTWGLNVRNPELTELNHDEIAVDLISLQNISSISDGEHFNMKERGTMLVAPKLSLNYEETFTAVISHVENNGSIWLQLCDNLSSLTDMMAKLNESTDKLLEPIAESPVIGNVYVCPYSVDYKLYRASVKEVLDDPQFVVVHYIDYGNEALLRVDNLFRAPENLVTLPAQAFLCFFDEAIRNTWSECYQSLVEEIETDVCVSVFPDSKDCGNIVIRKFITEGRDILALLQCGGEN
ncbi:tudor domain-containing 6-like isoform X2 [Palaemon carinicauda]|uniref:tudor domain-containing 6-like isoform X2 n=1 Tax=Palaemon carinicauda TaxID=392227 RepID=UPI0035B5F266